MKKIIIFGAGGNGIDVLDTVNDINRSERTPKYECVGFLDNNKSLWGKEFHGIKVLGPIESAPDLPESYVFAHVLGGVEDFWHKKEIIESLKLPIERFEIIVHPTASVSNMSKIGHGTVVLQNVTIASNVTVGNHVIILPNSIISHDTVVKDYTTIAGGVCVSGCITIGECCYLGTNSSINGFVKIGDFSLVGMGAVVLEDVQENSVVVGCPAKFLRNTK